MITNKILRKVKMLRLLTGKRKEEETEKILSGINRVRKSEGGKEITKEQLLDIAYDKFKKNSPLNKMKPLRLLFFA